MARGFRSLPLLDVPLPLANPYHCVSQVSVPVIKYLRKATCSLFWLMVSDGLVPGHLALSPLPNDEAQYHGGEHMGKQSCLPQNNWVAGAWFRDKICPQRQASAIHFLQLSLLPKVPTIPNSANS